MRRRDVRGSAKGVCVRIRGNEGCWGCVCLCLTPVLSPPTPQGTCVSLFSRVPKVRQDKSGPLSHLRPNFKCDISRDPQRYSWVDILQPCFPGHEALLVQI